jgi:hypothetical protein
VYNEMCDKNSETDYQGAKNILTDELFAEDECPEEGAEIANLPKNKRPPTLAN